jgi:hypothetical protein
VSGEIVSPTHRIKTQDVDVVLMTWQTCKHNGFATDNVAKPCGITLACPLLPWIAGWSSDVVDDYAKLLLWLLTS